MALVRMKSVAGVKIPDTELLQCRRRPVGVEFKAEMKRSRYSRRLSDQAKFRWRAAAGQALPPPGRASLCHQLLQRMSLHLAQMRSGGCVEQCPSSGAKRKASARGEYFASCVISAVARNCLLAQIADIGQANSARFMSARMDPKGSSRSAPRPRRRTTWPAN